MPDNRKRGGNPLFNPANALNYDFSYPLFSNNTDEEIIIPMDEDFDESAQGVQPDLQKDDGFIISTDMDKLPALEDVFAQLRAKYGRVQDEEADVEEDDTEENDNTVDENTDDTVGAEGEVQKQEVAAASTEKPSLTNGGAVDILLMAVSVITLGVSYLYEFAQFIGRVTVEFFAYYGNKIRNLVSFPLKRAGVAVTKWLRKLQRKIMLMPKTTLKDFMKFFAEAKFVRTNAKKLNGKRSFPVAKALARYVLYSFKRHNRFWRTVFNTAFPIIAVLVLVSSVEYRNNTTYALEVTYNGNVVGYVENEQVFNDAKNTALNLLSVGGTSSEKFGDAVYSIKRVTLNKLSDASVISDRLIANTDVDYVQACGIYIDGEFLCAVKNEADAVTVFDSILEPYEAKAAADDIVAFVEEIEYVQGLYADTENVIWDTAKLKQTVMSEKTAAVYYTVKSGDTISGIAAKYNLTTKELLKLNPKASENRIYIGDVFLVSQEVNFVRVKVMKTEQRTESIAYSTVRKDSSTLYKGTTKTVQRGSNGSRLVTELVTYIDGVQTYASLISSKTVKEPVDEIIYVGTKSAPSYSGSSSASSQIYQGSTSKYGFCWPAVGAYKISSRYGYRTLRGRRGFHSGVDIVRSGGNSGGLPVVAAQSGTVVSAGYSGGYGNCVVIDHGGGVKTRYAHMRSGSLSVRVGSRVSRGQQIGRIGTTGNSTGNHLHFEVIINGRTYNPLNYIG